MTRVEGVDYSPEGIESLRQALIEMRGRTFGYWPESIDVTLVLTHTIAILAESASAEKALTEIQRVVSNAVSKGDNSSYIDQISDIITDQML